MIRDILIETESDNFSILLDPFKLAQAFYVPGKIYLPFKSSPLPEIDQPKLSEYTELPFYDKVLNYLKIAQKIHIGYSFSQNIYDNFGNVVEIETESGLRIPISPKRMKINSETTEVMKTVNDIGEQELVFGNPSEKIISEKEKISYTAEVYEFLIFQLTNDLETDYKDLRYELQNININLKRVDELLKQWFFETITFVDISTPTTFLSKIRSPCSKNSCDGNLCGVENGICKITIQNKVNKEKLYHKLISTLVENQKIRAMILDGRTTPFFSTILYIELPHEVVLSDNQLD